MEKLTVARVRLKTCLVIKARQGQRLAESCEMLVQLSVRDVPGTGMGAVRSKGSGHGVVGIASLHQTYKPLIRRGLGVLRQKDQEFATRATGERVPGVTVAKLLWRNGGDIDSACARQIDRSIGRARVDDQHLERPRRALRQHGVQHLSQQCAAVFYRDQDGGADTACRG